MGLDFFLPLTFLSPEGRGNGEGCASFYVRGIVLSVPPTFILPSEGEGKGRGEYLYSSPSLREVSASSRQGV